MMESAVSLRLRALLGISFWEMGTDTPVTEGLVVRAYALDPQGNVRRGLSPIHAVPNAEGVYVFHKLPGWSGPHEAADGEADPIEKRSFLFEVRDDRGRFLPMAMKVTEPHRRSDLFWTAGQPLQVVPPRVYLFSAPSRSVPSTMAALRTQLWDDETGAPAAHALVEVTHGADVWHGLADTQGSVLVLFAYPKYESSGSTNGDGGWFDRSWGLEVRVRYQRDTHGQVPRLGLMDLAAIVNQPYARIVAHEGELPVDVLECSLSFGEELILRTEGASTLGLVQ